MAEAFLQFRSCSSESNHNLQFLRSAADKAAHDRMVKLVEQMLELHRQIAAVRTPQEKTALERQITATDAEIDRLVYQLYGLTADEIKTVEATAK